MSDVEKFGVDEAGQRLNMTKHQVYRRIQTGQLSAEVCRDDRRRYMLTQDDIDKYLASEDRTGPTAELVKASDVARRTGLSVEMVRKLCDEGELTHRRGTGGRGHYYISRSSVDEYLSRSNA